MALCEECNAECCRYITCIIQTPKDEADWDEIKWMLLHEGVTVYVDKDGDWNVETLTNCKNLDEKTKKCKDYENRPHVCRDHGTHECEGNDLDKDQLVFETPEDVDEYLKRLK